MFRLMGGGVKGFLNNVKKTALFYRMASLTEDESHTLNGLDPKTQFGAQILIWFG